MCKIFIINFIFDFPIFSSSSSISESLDSSDSALLSEAFSELESLDPSDSKPVSELSFSLSSESAGSTEEDYFQNQSDFVYSSVSSLFESSTNFLVFVCQMQNLVYVFAKLHAYFLCV